MLTARDPLPSRPRRILVAGGSGSGKSTLSVRLAESAGLPYQEIDALYHGEGWVPRPTFVDEVDAFTAQPAWVIEWQYTQARELLASRADTMVWLDLPRRVVMRQVVRRTVTRASSRTELWNGNVEPPLRTFFTDPDHIVRWAWRTHGDWAERVRRAEHDLPGLTVVRLRSHTEADAWLNGPFRNAIASP